MLTAHRYSCAPLNVSLTGSTMLATTIARYLTPNQLIIIWVGTQGFAAWKCLITLHNVIHVMISLNELYTQNKKGTEIVPLGELFACP